MRILVLLAGLFISISASATSQLKLDLMLAKRGDVSAQYSVATAYEFGTDIKKDLKQSYEWYMKAANQSHAPSQYKVGYFYENGMGVAKNVNSAMSWYKKAKANGSNQASKRLNKTAFEKNEKAKKARRAALQEKLDQEEKARIAKEKKLAKKRAADKKQVRKEAKKVVKKNKGKVVATATVKIPDIMKVVLNSKWKNNHGSADYLPSASTTCLESGDNELTCFSSEKSRKVRNSNVTYTAKSTIAGFKPNGSFKVFYNYNGISVDGSKTNASDIYGLSMNEGWQEPAIAVKCQASNRKNITCYRGSKKVSFKR